MYFYHPDCHVICQASLIAFGSYARSQFLQTEVKTSRKQDDSLMFNSPMCIIL